MTTALNALIYIAPLLCLSGLFFIMIVLIVVIREYSLLGKRERHSSQDELERAEK
jgi:uncharacterized membrane protein